MSVLLHVNRLLTSRLWCFRSVIIISAEVFVTLGADWVEQLVVLLQLFGVTAGRDLHIERAGFSEVTEYKQLYVVL